MDVLFGIVQIVVIVAGWFWVGAQQERRDNVTRAVTMAVRIRSESAALVDAAVAYHGAAPWSAGDQARSMDVQLRYRQLQQSTELLLDVLRVLDRRSHSHDGWSRELVALKQACETEVFQSSIRCPLDVDDERIKNMRMSAMDLHQSIERRLSAVTTRRALFPW